MFPDLPRRGLLPVLAAVAALASPALAGPAEDCRNRDLDDTARMAPCTTAIEAASDPADRADLLLWRGAIHKRARDFEQAEADFAAAQALRPDWADPHVERAHLLKEQGDLEGALTAVRQGWEAEPSSL